MNYKKKNRFQNPLRQNYGHICALSEPLGIVRGHRGVAVAEEGWRIVGLTRLSPIFSFNLQNYAYGLTRVTLRGVCGARF